MRAPVICLARGFGDSYFFGCDSGLGLTGDSSDFAKTHFVVCDFSHFRLFSNRFKRPKKAFRTVTTNIYLPCRASIINGSKFKKEAFKAYGNLK